MQTEEGVAQQNSLLQQCNVVVCIDYYFFSFCVSGEITVESKFSNSSSNVDLAVDNAANPSTISIQISNPLKQTKPERGLRQH